MLQALKLGSRSMNRATYKDIFLHPQHRQPRLEHTIICAAATSCKKTKQKKPCETVSIQRSLNKT